MHQIAINGGLIIDVLSGKVQRRNIGISMGKIAEITESEIEGEILVNAEGLHISPGFIDFHSHVDGKEYSAECVLRQGGTTTIGGERSFDGRVIFDIEQKGFLINQGFNVSHSFTIRAAAGIKDRYRAATEAEIRKMEDFTEQFFENGAYGIHFGLEFVPGTSFEEITRLARVAGKHGRVMLVHLRKDGKEALESFNEIFNVCRSTGVSVHILHLMYMVGFPGIMDQALELIDAAVAEGLDITADTGLFAAYPSCIGSSILDEGWEKGYGSGIGVKNLLISSGIYAGMYCDDKLFNFLREESPNTLVTVFACDESQIRKAIVKPYAFVSTNAADGPHYKSIGHPETSGTFPKLIRKYVHDEKILDLVESIRKITILPAKRFGIKNKGFIGIGADADLVIFDYDRIKEMSDYTGIGDPNAPPQGISHILVNGELVVDDNILLTKSAGSLLKYK